MSAAQSISKLSYLSMVEIFQDLSPDEMKRLEQVTAMVTTKKGKVFFNPEEPAEVLFILKKGQVGISRINPDGKKLTIERLGPGTVFGEMTALGQRMHQTYAEALTDCLICVMSRSDVENILLSDPRVAIRIAQSIGKRLAEAEARLEEMAFRSVPERLASLLLRLADRTDWRGRRMVDGLTHQQLAELVGSYRETVTLTLNQFRADSLIDIGRRRVVILDEDGLSAIATD